MGEPNEILRQARIRAGFATATDAARAFGWTESTYLGHENGDRPISKKAGIKYANAFKLDVTALLYDKPQKQQHRQDEPTIDTDRLVQLFGWLLHWRGLPHDEAENLAAAVVEYARKPPSPDEPAPDRETIRIEARALLRMLSPPQR